MHAYSTDDARWQAVRERDRSANGTFLFGVVTTGVYCRPGCSSRTPRRENVRFYTNPAEAEGAGLRPCKRCAPNEQSEDAALTAITRACAQIEQADTVPTLAELAAGANLSPFHFQRLFRRIVGVTPKQYALARRRDRIGTQLRDQSSVTEAIYGAGFGSASQFYGADSMSLGMTPREYRAGATGKQIRFAVAPSYLGWVLVAATEQGLCAIELGDTAEAVEQTVRARFPKASFSLDDSFAQTVGQVVAFMEAPERGLDLPLDIQGTSFQQRVWAALREVPAGATVSYAELSARIGQPTAARAVAQACAANTLAVAIPCHRVVRESGEISGYRWGAERKRALLARERPSDR